ncbi:MFS transporter [Gaiella sp.]|uniref:MFS transporter n=1 Tax=Gaiella sp. TaxID=2663207 RepID=UPI0032651CF2
MKIHLRLIRRVVAVVARNPDIRRVQIAFSAFNGAEWAVWIAMLVYAYGRGGATAAGLVALFQMIPATLFAPFAAVLGDRYRPARVLTLGYFIQATAMGATAAALLLDGPPALAYTCAAVAATATTMTRPTMAALTPGLCRTPEELTASNVVAGWSESTSILVAPALAGLILAVSSPGWVFLVMGTAVLGGALLVMSIPGPAANPASGTSVRKELVEGFSVVASEPSARTLVGLLGAEQIALGMLDVLYVVLAVSVLGMGNGGAGYLNAAFGLGGALAIAITATLVGRARLIPAIVGALAVWATAFILLAIVSTIVAAMLLLVVAGASHSLFDVSGRTLLQRTAPPEVLARVFGVLECLMSAGIATGALLAPLLVHLGGTTAAIVGTGILLPVMALLIGRRLFALDASATVPIVEIGLLRSLRLFSALSPPSLEGIARSLQPLEATAGTPIVTQGEDGEHYYAIAEGELEVVIDGKRVTVLTRGDGFGEIALLHDCTRTATVAALTDVKLYSLAKEPFLQVLTGHPAAMDSATAIVAERR